MIDHIIGALYFLHHFGYPHGAVRPENIMIDEEGKYILIDPRAFCSATNYHKALDALQSETIRDSLFETRSDSWEMLSMKSVFLYLAPELINHLKVKHLEHKENSEKVDIYSVGIMALKMCLMDRDIAHKLLNR